MHNIKDIRKNFDEFVNSIKKRNQNLKLENILELDKKNRSLIQNKETLEKEKKDISKSKDKSLFEKSKKISTEIDLLNTEQNKIKTEIENILSSLPNLALNDVPVGKDEKSNVEVETKGEIRKFDFKPKSHYELGDSLKMLDFDVATKTSGSRFVFLKGYLAMLERAISNFMLDTHIKEFGYQEVSPPLIVSDKTMYGTGQLPKFETDQFELILKKEENDRKFLIPTAEVVLTNIVRESNVKKELLPLRFVASTACFRKEAGSYGKDTKGMIRQHQFYKVELVSIVEKEKCSDELERMTKCAEKILKDIKLPYRQVLLSTGDMGFSAEKTYDLEVWIPSENKYREISSCSSCGQFQARRMKAKYKNGNESNFVGTLNGSGLAVGRTLIAIMENYQQKDGSIKVPDVLKPYMRDQQYIK